MKVVKLEIENFRGIKRAALDFDGHTLIVAKDPNRCATSSPLTRQRRR
jgi:predicted ATP-dependent endonuclease of OLD family